MDTIGLHVLDPASQPFSLSTEEASDLCEALSGFDKEGMHQTLQNENERNSSSFSSDICFVEEVLIDVVRFDEREQLYQHHAEEDEDEDEGKTTSVLFHKSSVKCNLFIDRHAFIL